ncbi:MAG: sulfite exporter TauE/SafE family protein [bacterium]|nr:sulfite exporter TauE/SafE family protein [bacterium]
MAVAATNRLAVFVGSLISILTFWKQQKTLEIKLIYWEFSLFLAVPAIIGSMLGARIIVSIPDKFVKMILLVAMLIAIVIIFFKLKRNISTETQVEQFSLKKKILLCLSFFLIGFYGGAIQAGIGFLIL